MKWIYDKKERHERVEILVFMLNYHEEEGRWRGDWGCKDHNAMGPYNTNRFCCAREYYYLTNPYRTRLRNIYKVIHNIACVIYNRLLIYIYGKEKN